MQKYLDGKEWVAIWKKAGPALEAQEEEEWRRLDYEKLVGETVEYDEDLAAAFPPPDTSGLVQWNELVKKQLRLATPPVP